MKYLTFIFLLFLSLPAISQLSAADDSLVLETTFSSPADFSLYRLPGNSQKMMKTRQPGFFANYNPVALALKGSMWAYQNVISAQLSSPCPYEISCSNFAKSSIREFGVVKGVAIAADRLMRCNRISLTEISPLDMDPKTHHIIDQPDRYRWHQH